jgi:hypothetical protein
VILISTNPLFSLISILFCVGHYYFIDNQKDRAIKTQRGKGGIEDRLGNNKKKRITLERVCRNQKRIESSYHGKVAMYKLIICGSLQHIYYYYKRQSNPELGYVWMSTNNLIVVMLICIR